MNYILSTTYNSNGLIKYLNHISTDYKLFLRGVHLEREEVNLNFSVIEDISKEKLLKFPIIESSGPILINKTIKEILEKETSFVQFFPVTLSIGNESISDFYAINIMAKIKCIDMNLSEFKPINFDVNNPQYMFYYIVLMDNPLNNLKITICKEMSRYIVINDDIKNNLIENKIRGLKFVRL